MCASTVSPTPSLSYPAAVPVLGKVRLQQAGSILGLMAWDGLVLYASLELGARWLGQVYDGKLLPLGILMLWLLLSSLGLYSSASLPQHRSYCRAAMGMAILGWIGWSASYYYAALAPLRTLFVLTSTLGIPLLGLGRWSYHIILGRYPSATLVLGGVDMALQLERNFPQGRIVGRIAPGDALEVGTVGTLQQLPDLLSKYQPRNLIVNATTLSPELFQRVLDSCDRASVQLLVLHPPWTGRRKLHVHYSPIPLVEVQESWSYTAELLVKRGLDFVGAGVGVVLLSPLLVLIALLIVLDSPGPVFFRQERLGRDGQRFRIWKFRTMVVDAERQLAALEPLNESKGGVLFKMQKDPRITSLGHFLRRTSLDEVPQLFNVLLGHMSLVGPRPLQLRDCELALQQNREAFNRRLAVLPGVTGLWQVRARSSVGFEEMLYFDLEYIENWALVTDLHILWETIGVVLRRKDAY